MTTTQDVYELGNDDLADARDHLWMHFTRHVVLRRAATCRSSCAARAPTSGTTQGKRYLDGLAGPVRRPGRARPHGAGRGGRQAGRASSRSSRSGPTPTRRPSSWPSGSPTSRPATSTGSSSPPAAARPSRAAWKLAKQYFKLTGKPMKHKVISRDDRLPRHAAGRAVDHRHPGREGDVRAAGARRASRCPTPTSTGRPNTATTSRRSAGGPPTAIERGDRVRGPRHGRRGLPRAGAELRRLLPAAARLLPAGPRDLRPHDVLLVSDEVICAFGRLGRLFGCDRYGYVPDIITCAKGMTSGYSPIGAMIATDRIIEPFLQRRRRRSRTATRSAATRCRPRSRWPTSTSSSARGSTSTCGQRGRVPRDAGEAAATCRSSATCAATGYFYGIELVKDKATKETFDDDESERLLRGFLSKALFDAGPLLPRRRPRRPGHPARAAADLRPGAVRRDRADPARRC